MHASSLGYRYAHTDRLSNPSYGHANIGLRMMLGSTIVPMASAKVRDLDDEQNERVREVVRQLLPRFKNQTEAAKALGMGSQSALSGFLSRRQGTSVMVALRVAAAADIDLWDVIIDQNKPPIVSSGHDPAIGTFLMRLRRLPGLLPWVEEHPSDFTISQVAKAMKVYEDAKPTSRADGQPINGWGPFIADAVAGRITEERAGDLEGAMALETRQLPPATRARMRSARKKT
jgi:hypothetical protein